MTVYMYFVRSSACCLYVRILPTAVYGFYNTDESDHPLAGLLGILSSMQWLFILVLPLVQVSVNIIMHIASYIMYEGRLYVSLSFIVGSQSDQSLH